MSSPAERLRAAVVERRRDFTSSPPAEPVSFVRIRATDRDALLRLVEACSEQKRKMEIAGNVSPGVAAEGAWAEYDNAEKEVYAALAAITFARVS